MADDLGERTEEATPKRRQQARDEGNVPRSQDLAAAIMLIAVTGMLAATALSMLGRFKVVLEAVLAGDTLGNPLDPAAAPVLMAYVASAGIRIAAPMLLLTFAAAFVAQLSQVGWLFAPKVLMPRLSKLNPASGFKRIFGITGLTRLVTNDGQVIGDVTAIDIKIRADKMVEVHIECLPRNLTLNMTGTLKFHEWMEIENCRPGDLIEDCQRIVDEDAMIDPFDEDQAVEDELRDDQVGPDA